MQTFSPIPECTICLTTKEDGGIVGTKAIENLLEQGKISMRAIALPAHAHSIHIKEIAFPDVLSDKNLIADGLYTQERLVMLAHCVADCAPVIILDRRKKALLTLHAGWRGAAQSIVGLGILTLQAKYKSQASDLWVWIGPCLQSASNIRTSVPVQAAFSSWKNHIHVRDDGFHVDLPGFIYAQALEFGVHETQIINDGRDTYTEADMFFSHKRAHDTSDINQDQRFVVGAWLN